MLVKQIGIFGGSFDPIHRGHIAIADQVVRRLLLERLHILPCGQHALGKRENVSTEHRLAMLDIALASEHRFQLDCRELERKGISYTVESCRELRSEYGESARLCLIIGSDNFNNLHMWYQWRELLELVNLVIVDRASDNLAANGNSDGQTQPIAEISALLQNMVEGLDKAYGQVAKITLPDYPFSSSSIRNLLKQLSVETEMEKREGPTYHKLLAVLDSGVLDYIVKNRLYSG